MSRLRYVVSSAAEIERLGAMISQFSALGGAAAGVHLMLIMKTQ